MRALIILFLSINFPLFANDPSVQDDPIIQSKVNVVTNEIRVVDYGWKNERTVPIGTVVKRVTEKDPKWWSAGMALEIPHEDGWQVVYTARSNWETGLREKQITEFVDPNQAFKTVEDAVSPSTNDDCHENEDTLEKAPILYENEREAELMSKVKPVKSSFQDIMDIVQKSKTPGKCFVAVRKYLRDESPWSGLTVKERAELMGIKARQTMAKIKAEGKKAQEEGEFGRFKNLCKEKVLTKEAERVKIYAQSASDQAVASVIKKYESKIGGKSGRIWVEKIPDLYREAAIGIPIALKEKVLANLNIDEEGKEMVKEQLESLPLPTEDEFITAIKAQYRGYTNLRSRDVKKFIAQYVTNAFLPFVKGHVDQVSTEMDKKLESEEVKSKYGGIKRHGKFCFQLVGEMYNDGGTTIPLEAINALEPVLSPGLPVEDRTKRYLNPNVFHDDLNENVALCIARTETGIDALVPNSINYTYCGNVGTVRGKRNYPPSTATGFDHTVVKTIDGLRKKGVLPLSTLPQASQLDPKNYWDNKSINALKADSVDTQFEISLRHMNYLMKIGHTKKTRGKSLSGDVPSSVEIAVIHYDQDNESGYVKTFNRCFKCLEESVPAGKKTLEECIVPKSHRTKKGGF